MKLSNRPTGTELALAFERWLVEAEREGELRGLRAGLGCVLTARGLKLSELGQARVDACDEVAILTRLLDRAAGATCEADVFAGANAGEQLRAQGFAQGFAEGRISALLAARGVLLSEGGRARIAARVDEGTLTCWIDRAATATSEDEVFESES